MKISNIIKTIVAFIIAAIHFVPIYIAIVVALKPKTDSSSRWLLPKQLYLENFTRAIENAHILTAVKNSVIITLVTVFLVILIGGMAAYPIARNKTKFNKYIFILIIGVMMVPPLSIIVPLLTMFSRIGAVSTYWGIILVNTTYLLPLSIFLYTKFISTIPESLDEAATIDGCSRFSVFFRIILPLLKSTTTTVAILTGVAVWNEYQFALYLIQAPGRRVVTLAIASFFGAQSLDLGGSAASALSAILPILILYVFLQKYFIKGMVEGAIKG